MNLLEMGFVAEAEVEITYGPLRLAVAEHFGIDPAAVTDIHVVKYENEKEG